MIKQQIAGQPINLGIYDDNQSCFLITNNKRDQPSPKFRSMITIYYYDQ